MPRRHDSSDSEEETKVKSKKSKSKKDKDKDGGGGGAPPPPPPPAGAPSADGDGSSKKKKIVVNLSDSDSDSERKKKSASSGGAPPPPPPPASSSGAPPPPPPPSGASPGAPPPPPAPPGSSSPAGGKAEAIVAQADKEKQEAEKDDGPWDKAKKYTGYLEKVAKYSKRWVRRWCVLEDLAFSYANDDKSPAKHTLQVVKVTRGAEEKKDPLSLVLDCEDEHFKPAQLVFKAEDRTAYDKWLKRFRTALIKNEKWEDPDEGLPVTHPKTHLEFVGIPLELLGTFAPLDRLCLHFFSPVDLRVAGGKEEKMMVFLGDRLLYVCKTDANITRCVQMKDVYRLFTVAEATGNLMHVGVQCGTPEYDICFKLPKTKGEDFAKKLVVLHQEFSGSRKPLTEEKLDRLDLLTPQLNLSPTEFYRLSITLPMSKKFLVKMIKEWVKAAPASPKTTKSGGDASKEEAADPKKVANPMGVTSPLSAASAESTPASPLAGLNRQSSEPTIRKAPSTSKPASKAPLRIVGSPQTKADATGKILIPPGVDKVHRLLLYVGLPQYYPVFTEKGIDWEVLLCMTMKDLANKGVSDEKHQIIIEGALNDAGVMEAMKSDATGPAPTEMGSSSASAPSGGSAAAKDSKTTSNGPAVAKEKEKNGPPRGSTPSSGSGATAAPSNSTTKSIDIIRADQGSTSGAQKPQTIEFDDEDL